MHPSTYLHAKCDGAHVWMCCQCAEVRAFARVGAAVVVHRDHGREPPTHRPTEEIDRDLHSDLAKALEERRRTDKRAQALLAERQAGVRAG